MIENKKQILEGSHAIALAINNIRPEVVSAYPITPQTHIVEDLAEFKDQGLGDYEYIRGESEFAAASIILGAAASGSRTYSATSSQGLLLMAEVIFNIAGSRLPVVMTCANRAVSAPINIWNDHQDVMTIRDSGFMLLFAENHQEAVDQHIMAYALAEKLSLPVMVNVDGFILTHSYEPVYVPDKKTIKKYLAPYRPEKNTYLDPKNPVTIGAFATPNDYAAFRNNLQEDLLASKKNILEEYQKYQTLIGQGKVSPDNNGLFEYYGSKKAKNLIIAMGSVVGTIKEFVDHHPETAVLKIRSFRPFPYQEIAVILKRFSKIAVLEKAISLGASGPLYAEIATALNIVRDQKNRIINDYIVGLGGKDITLKDINAIVKDLDKKNKEQKIKIIC